MKSTRARLYPAICSLLVAGLVASMLLVAAPAARAQAVLLPDLVSDKPFPVSMEVLGANGNDPGQLVVRFHGYVTNLGDGPLDIAGNPQLADPNDPNSHSVYQRGLVQGAVDRGDASNFVNLTKARVQYETADGHNHFHLMEISRYSLWNVDRTAMVSPGLKVGFCLYDSNRQANRHPNPAPYYYSFSVVQWCDSNQPGSTDIRMGTSEGWRDTYSSHLTFQWVDASDVAPGEYYLAAEADPAGRIVESDETNNDIAYANQKTIIPGYVAQASSVTAGPGANPVSLSTEAFGSPGAREFVVTEAPSHGSLNVAVGSSFTADQIQYTPDAGYNGADSFRYVARQATSAFPLNPPAATVSISVGTPQVTVAISGAPATMEAGTSVDLNATVSNAGGGVTWSTSSGTITSSGLLTAPAAAGTLTVRATSTAAPAVYDEVQIAVAIANAAPSVEGVPAQNSIIGETVSLDLAASDPNPGDVLTWSVSGLPEGLDYNRSTGRVTGTPSLTQSRTVNVTVTDSGGLNDTTSFTWTISRESNTSFQLVTSGTNYSAGWIVRDGTKQWLSARCRQQLEAAGASFAIQSYNTFGSLPAASPALSCGAIQDLLTPAGPTPTTPTNLGYELVNGKVVLSWNPSVDDTGIREYEVKRDGQWVGYAPHPLTTWTDPDPTGVHLYEIRAVDLDLNYSGSVGVTVDVTGNNAAVQLVVNNATNTAGWAIVDGTKQWLNSSCRNVLEAAGATFEIQTYSSFGSLPGAQPLRQCSDLVAMLGGGNPGAGATLVVNNTNNTAGWVIIDGAKQWLNAACRAQLETAGGVFTVTPYNDFGSLPPAAPLRSCNQIQALL